MSDYDSIAREHARRRIFEVLSGKVSSNILLEQAAGAATANQVAKQAAAGTGLPGPRVPKNPTVQPSGVASKRLMPSADPAQAAKKAATKQVVKQEEEEKAEKKEPEMILDEAATEAAKAEMIAQADIFAKGFDLISESDADKIATAIHDATKEEKWTNLWTGAGTDEEGLAAAIKSIPTLMDLSFVSYVFEQKYRGAYTWTPTLKAVFESELDDEDMYSIVEVAVRAMPFISIAGKKYTQKEFEELANQGAELAKSVDQGIDFKGVASSAAGGVAAASATMGALGAAGLVAGTSTVTAAGLGTAALGGATGGLVGGGFAAVGATTTAAATTAAASSATAAGLAAGGSAASLPVIGSALAAIPGPGWAILGVVALGAGAYMLFSGGDLDQQVELSLSSENYTKMQGLFEEISNNFRETADKIEIMVPAPEPEVEEDEEGEVEEEEGAAPVVYAPLPFRGLAQPYIKNIQIVMNEYCMTREISTAMIEEDGQWGPETQGRWENEFAGHALDNHSIFSASAAAAEITDSDLAGKQSWKKMSRKLISEFPGYNSSQRGMLAFCIDAYNDNADYGSRTQRSGGTGRSSGGGGRTAAAAGGATAGAAMASTKPAASRTIARGAIKKLVRNVRPMRLDRLPGGGGQYLINDNPQRKASDQIDRVTLWMVGGQWPASAADITADNISKVNLRLMRAGALKRSADFKPSGSPDAKTIAILKALLFA